MRKKIEKERKHKIQESGYDREKWKEKKKQRRKDGRRWEGEEKNWSLYLYVKKRERDKDILYYVKKKGKKKEKRRRKTSTDDCRADVNWTVKRIRIEVD